MSTTRWSARVDCVKPFSNNILKIRKAITLMLQLNLKSETITDLNGITSVYEIIRVHYNEQYFAYNRKSERHKK